MRIKINLTERKKEYSRDKRGVLSRGENGKKKGSYLYWIYDHVLISF